MKYYVLYFHCRNQIPATGFHTKRYTFCHMYFNEIYVCYIRDFFSKSTMKLFKWKVINAPYNKNINIMLKRSYLFFFFLKIINPLKYL